MGEKKAQQVLLSRPTLKPLDFESKKQRYDELMTRQTKGEFLSESERRRSWSWGRNRGSS